MFCNVIRLRSRHGERALTYREYTPRGFGAPTDYSCGISQRCLAPP
ncbi:hypothetical protein HMPREF0742_00716 [Rothia aeria F0184]|uniref:Uncharacterized protein n=1 Tax=Rothia aeria F0184 TaxID=888019 RepID=U7V5Q1_9MICC|nr:hypothetical protein HMPREF0742_00716 [Rothia aeria F0184]